MLAGVGDAMTMVETVSLTKDYGGRRRGGRTPGGRVVRGRISAYAKTVPK
jgi:hypothetical protein